MTRATGELDAASTGIKVTLEAGDFTIDMDKSATPAKDVRGGDNDVVLATISMVSNGENATTLYMKDAAGDEFKIYGTGTECSEIENVELRNVDTGVTYDVTVASSTAAMKCLLTIDEEISFVKGETKTFELRVDLLGPNDSNPIENNDTLQVQLESGAFSITGDESDAAISVTPSSVTSAIATVKDASLIWQQYSMTDKTVVPGAEEIVIYKAGLEAGDSSYVKLSSVKISATGTVSVAFDDDNITKLDLYIDGKLVKSRSGAITEGVAARNYINFTSLATNNVIDAGASVILELRAAFAGSFTSAKTGPFDLGMESATLSVIAKDKDNNEVVESGLIGNTDVSSRKVTLAETGELKVELKVDDQKANNDTYLLAGSETTTDRYLGELVFTTRNEAIKVQELVIENEGSANSSDIALIKLYDDTGAVVAEKSPSADGHAYFNNFDYVFAADQATSLFIGVVGKSINAEGDDDGTATHADTIIFAMADATAVTAVGASTAVKAVGDDSGEDLTMTQDVNDTIDWNEFQKATTTSKTATLTGSVLNSIVNTMDDGVLSGGNGKTIGEYKFVFDNGSNRTTGNSTLKAELAMLNITVASSSVTGISGLELYVDGDAANVITGTASTTVAGVWDFDLNVASGLAEDGLVDGEVTLIITANITGVGTNAFVQTEITDLNGAGYFIYNGNSGTGTDFVDTLLDVIKVTGGTLSN